jgi:AraC family transcriptional regulator
MTIAFFAKLCAIHNVFLLMLGVCRRLPDLAERAALSAYHFARAFKTSTGTTPRAFIELRRIERTKQLLGESVLSLADIALEAGFETQSRFTTAFRRSRCARQNCLTLVVHSMEAK